MGFECSGSGSHRCLSGLGYALRPALPAQAATLKNYFLAGNVIPWWAISLSIVAAETSTLTVISVPGMAYDKDFRFLQLVFGYLIGRVVVSFVFIPQYFRGELVTAYQLMDRRFGHKLRTLTAGMFLVTRAAAEGVRVFAVAIVVRVALGAMLTGLSDFQRDFCAIAIVTLLTLIYTFQGGMAAAIWTDVVQQTIYVIGTLVGFFTILHLVPGGWADRARVAGQAGKFRVFDYSFQSSPDLHLLVGRDRRRISYHCQPWHRSVDRAETAFRAQRAPIEDRSAHQRSRHPLSVLAVSR